MKGEDSLHGAIREQIKELFEHNMFVETLEYFFTEVDKYPTEKKMK